MSVSLLLLAAGRSERFASGQKLLAEISPGNTVLKKAIANAIYSSEWDCIVVVVNEHTANHAQAVLSTMEASGMTIYGGERRMDSVRAGLLACESEFVVIHDCARPLASRSLFGRVVASLEQNTAVIPVIPLSDTIYKTDEAEKVFEIPDRKHLYAVQTPQGFPVKQLAELHDKASREGSSFTDDGSMFFNAGLPVKLVQGEIENCKITTDPDFNAIRNLSRISSKESLI